MTESLSLSRTEVLRRYPNVVAHVIAESLGYATPSLAAKIVADARDGRQNWCEWIVFCYGGDPRKAVSDAIRRRHMHHGYMASYQRARSLVLEAATYGLEPMLASWF